MKWNKLGRVYVPDGSLWWAKSYAHLPTAYVYGNKVRVYYAGLDQQKYGRIGYLELNPLNLIEITDVSSKPAFDLGEPGCFDDSGVNPSMVVHKKDAIYLYYIGWQRCERVPYLLQAGLAKSSDGYAFDRVSRATILPLTDKEPFFRSAMTVVEIDGRYMAWYPSAIGWESIQRKLYPLYIIRHATSADGIHWQSHQQVSIGFTNDVEFGFGRPYVCYSDGRFQMWYSIRSRNAPYCMGYAESLDGITWERYDERVGISASDEGWDSEMVCYPCVFDYEGDRYMLYNGNQHGKTGFGIAILEKD